MHLLVQSHEKFFCVIQNFGSKTYAKFVKLRSFLKIFDQIFKNVKKIEKIYMDSVKSINSSEIKKERSLDYLYKQQLFSFTIL